MARNVINTGTIPNDGQGDALRTAFTKINANDAELYTGASISVGYSGTSARSNIINSQYLVVDSLTLSGITGSETYRYYTTVQGTNDGYNYITSIDGGQWVRLTNISTSILAATLSGISRLRSGVTQFTAGSAAVATALVTPTTRIMLTIQSPAGTVGSPYISARSTGSHFTIGSTSLTDTSSVAWLMVEP